jgi:hypothetical protein
MLWGVNFAGQWIQIKKLLYTFTTFTGIGSCTPYSPKVLFFLNYMHVHN